MLGRYIICEKRGNIKIRGEKLGKRKKEKKKKGERKKKKKKENLSPFLYCKYR